MKQTMKSMDSHNKSIEEGLGQKLSGRIQTTDSPLNQPNYRNVSEVVSTKHMVKPNKTKQSTFGMRSKTMKKKF